MPLTVSETHFSEGVWASDGPLRFRHYTCLECGARFKTFATFRAHRALANCMSLEENHADSQPAWALGQLSGADRAALEALAAQLPDPEPIDTAQWLEETVV